MISMHSVAGNTGGGAEEYSTLSCIGVLSIHSVAEKTGGGAAFFHNNGSQMLMVHELLIGAFRCLPTRGSVFFLL